MTKLYELIIFIVSNETLFFLCETGRL